VHVADSLGIWTVDCLCTKFHKLTPSTKMLVLWPNYLQYCFVFLLQSLLFCRAHATQFYFCGSIGKVTLHNLCNPKGLCVESELGYFFMQVYSEEWSFGYCEFGTGVFCCTPTMNPMYTHRESIVLGHILLSRRRIGQILSELSREWNGSSYDPLSRNCNHFCDALCERLGVPKLPRKAFLILILVLYLSSWVACQGKLEAKAKK
jgi:hypothetical protein